MTLTWDIVVGLIAVGIVFDIWTAYKNGGDSTISWTLYTKAQAYPVIAFVIGFVFGHIFWVQHGG